MELSLTDRKKVLFNIINPWLKINGFNKIKHHIPLTYIKTDKLKFIYYEFKSVVKVPPAKFPEQFLKDLQNAQSLDQIKWIFDGRKNPANFKENMLKAVDNLDLTDDLAKKFLKDTEATSEDLKDLLKSRSQDIFIIVK